MTTHMSPCVDCGAMVPTIRTGEGWHLGDCPKSKSPYYKGHRVARTAMEEAQREAAEQGQG